MINSAYQAYARAVGFHVDACPARQGNAKGKVEAKVKLGGSPGCQGPRYWRLAREPSEAPSAGV